MPRVSVVIPAFNAGRYLEATLESVMDSRCDDFDVVVVDDGSKDDTAEIAERYRPRVRVLRQANAGCSAARNAGIQGTDSEFVALLDSDDLWHPMKLPLQLQVAAQRPDTGIVFSDFVRWSGEGTPHWPAAVDDRLDPRLSGWIYHQMVLTCFVLTSSALVRRSTFTDVGLFRLEHQQTDDWEYFARVSFHKPLARLATPLVAYRQTPGSLSRRVAALNDPELMRDRMIATFGLKSPDGTPVDAEELRRRRYRGWHDFAAMHVERGDLRVGMGHFGRLLAEGPFRGQSALSMCKALARRVAHGGGRT